MKNKLTNLHWFEYLEKKEEELRYIEQTLQQHQMLVLRGGLTI